MALQPESRPRTEQTPHPTQEGSIELTILTVLATTPAHESDPAGNPEMQKYVQFLTVAFERTLLFTQLSQETQTYILRELEKLLKKIADKLHTPRNSRFTSRSIRTQFPDEYEAIFNTVKRQTTITGETIHGSKVGLMFTSAFNKFLQFLVAGEVLSEQELENYQKRARRAPAISVGERRTTKTTKHSTPDRRSGKQVF